MARLATGNTEEAMDVVQDAMFRLVEKYAGRPQDEWGALFNRILHNGINGWYRRSRVRNRLRVWFGSSEEKDVVDPLQTARDEKGRNPEQLLQSHRRIDKLEQALGELSVRQRQAFLLRLWEGLDVRATAKAMSCSEGSVKTHYSRAVHVLREQLGEDWP